MHEQAEAFLLLELRLESGMTDIARKRAEFEAAHPNRERVLLDPPPHYDAEYFAAMEIMDSEPGGPPIDP